MTVFAAVTLVLTAVLAFTIGNVSFASRTPYRAEFTDATGLLAGDDVRIAGVRVGTVTSVRLMDARYAVVGFAVDRKYPLTVGTLAQLRYRNLVGQRYLNLTPGPSSGRLLARNQLIPLSQTSPALDLTVLFNGFQPLFQALNPQAVNSLATEIISTLQGEGGNIDALLAHTASLTTTLADRDAVIGRVIGNLNTVLATVRQHDAGLVDVVDQLQRLVTGLAGDRSAIAASLGSIDALAGDTANLLDQVRPAVPTDLQQLSATAHLLATTTNGPGGPNTLDEFLHRIPYKLNGIARTATYGSWFNFYLCDLVIPGSSVQYHATAPSCGAR